MKHLVDEAVVRQDNQNVMSFVVTNHYQFLCICDVALQPESFLSILETCGTDYMDEKLCIIF